MEPKPRKITEKSQIELLSSCMDENWCKPSISQANYTWRTHKRRHSLEGDVPGDQDAAAFGTSPFRQLSHTRGSDAQSLFDLTSVAVVCPSRLFLLLSEHRPYPPISHGFQQSQQSPQVRPHEPDTADKSETHH
jgi:hypothetical protein